MGVPPGLVAVAVAAVGALALGVGAVALLNGVLLGAVVGLGGAALLAWSLVAQRSR